MLFKSQKLNKKHHLKYNKIKVFRIPYTLKSNIPVQSQCCCGFHRCEPHNRPDILLLHKDAVFSQFLLKIYIRIHRYFNLRGNYSQI